MFAAGDAGFSRSVENVTCHVSGPQLEPSSSGGQSVVDFGADQEGKADSAPAFNKALQSLGKHGGIVSVIEDSIRRPAWPEQGLKCIVLCR